MKRIFGLSKPVFILGIVSLLTDLSSEMIYPILPLFLAQGLGASTAFIGLIEGIAESTASLLKVFSGWLSDRLGKRKELILIGYGLSSLSKPLLAVAQSAWHVLGIRFADRLGKGIRGAPRDAMIADVTLPSERGKSFGFHRAMDTTGAILGPAAAFLLLPLFSDAYRPLFLVAAIPALLAVIIIVTMVRDEKEKKDDAPPANLPAPRVTEKQKLPGTFIFMMVIIGLFTLGNSSDAFLILRAQNVGITVTMIPLLWMAFNIVYTLVSIPAGRLSDSIGRLPLIIGGLVIYSLSYLGFAFVKTPLQVWILFAVYGIYHGATDGVIKAYIADVVPQNARGISYGIYNFVVGVLLFPANLLTGWLWKAYSPEVAFGFGAALAGAAVIGFMGLKFFPRHDTPA